MASDLPASGSSSRRGRPSSLNPPPLLFACGVGGYKRVFLKCLSVEQLGDLAGDVDPHLPVVDGQVGHGEHVHLRAGVRGIFKTLFVLVA